MPACTRNIVNGIWRRPTPNLFSSGCHYKVVKVWKEKWFENDLHCSCGQPLAKVRKSSSYLNSKTLKCVIFFAKENEHSLWFWHKHCWVSLILYAYPRWQPISKPCSLTRNPCEWQIAILQSSMQVDDCIYESFRIFVTFWSLVRPNIVHKLSIWIARSRWNRLLAQPSWSG